MGGFGSGRREYATTPTVGECHSLEIDELTEAVKHPGAFVPYRWRDEHGHGEEVASIGVHVERDGAPRFAPTLDDVDREDIADDLVDRATHLRLSYTVAPDRDDPSDHEHRIQLEYTPCPLGGIRPWLRCPAQGCSDRVGKLYRPPRAETFACRECYDLGYRSSRTSGDDLKQAELRYRRAFAKADAEDRRPHPNSDSAFFPERPSGMHHDTFEELLGDVRAAREEFHEQMQVRLRELTDQYDRL